MTADEIAADYYSNYYVTYTLSDGTSVDASNSEAVFEVDYVSNATFYSAYRADNKTYFSSKYQNPLYGYHFELDPADAQASYYRVVLTNTVNKLYPSPNATKTV